MADEKVPDKKPEQPKAGSTGPATSGEADKAAQREQARQKKEAELLADEPVVIHGGPGSFAIYGPGLGGSGKLKIDGEDITTISRWDDQSIRGTIPPGLEGEVLLECTDKGITRKGRYPYVPHNVMKVTTVTKEFAPKETDLRSEVDTSGKPSAPSGNVSAQTTAVKAS